MDRTALDLSHKKRIAALSKKIEKEGKLGFTEVFTSEKVWETISSEKIFLEGFDFPKILSVAPFTPEIYTAICMNCIRKSNFAQFRNAVQGGLFIPVLLSPYSWYSNEMVNFLSGVHHIPYWEFSFARDLALNEKAKRVLCSHCAGKQQQQILKSITGGGSRLRKENVRSVFDNLMPFMVPDGKIMDAVEKACADGDDDSLDSLVNLSRGIRKLRTAQAFDATLVLDDDETTLIPKGIMREADEGLAKLAQARELAARGLGLVIFPDLPVPQYMELIRDFRPAILDAVNGVIREAETEGDGSDIVRLQGHIGRLNDEIDRMQNLKRFTAYEATVGFLGKNMSVVSAALAASALGLASTWVGCLAAGAASKGVSTVAKRLDLLKPSKTTERFFGQVKRDLRPVIVPVLAKYLGGSAPAMNILSLRQVIEKEKSRSSPKFLPKTLKKSKATVEADV